MVERLLLFLLLILPTGCFIKLRCISHQSQSHQINKTIDHIYQKHNLKAKIELPTKEVHHQIPQCTISNSQTGKALTVTGITKITYDGLSSLIALVKSNLIFSSFLDASSPDPHLTLFGSTHTSAIYIQCIELICRKFQAEKNSPFYCFFVDVLENPIVFAYYVNMKIPFVKIVRSESESPIYMIDKWPNFHKYTLLINDGPKSQEIENDSGRFFHCPADETCLKLDQLFLPLDQWNLIRPIRPPAPIVLFDSGIEEATEDVWNIIQSSQSGSHLPSLVTLLVTYIIDECSSCENSVAHLENLRHTALLNNANLFYINCTSYVDFCKKQQINGFPSLIAYRLKKEYSSECYFEDMTITSVSYHGAFYTAHLLEWFEDIADENIHYAAPHTFHSGCNIHLIIKTSPSTVDEMKVECLLALCRQLNYAECFVLGDDLFVSSVQLQRRDGVSSTIYSDNVPLSTSLMSTADLHIGHGKHDYIHEMCQNNRMFCYKELMKFIKEHSRMPLTELMPMIFHTRSSHEPLFSDLPIAVILLTDELLHSDVMETITNLSNEFYSRFAFTYVNVDRYPMWVKGMSPKSVETPQPDSWVFSYPRLVIFYWEDHYNAAFSRSTGLELSESVVRSLLESFLVEDTREPCHGI